jgi:2-methylcitrate dehydratase PrpD
VVAPEEEKRAPRNPVEAMHSMYFGAAMAILKRRAFIEEHTQHWLDAPEVQALIQKIHCHHDPALDKLLPEKFPARAVIQTADGKKFEKLFEIPQGDGLNPLSLEELKQKYRPLARAVFSQDIIDRIETQVLNLEDTLDFSDIAMLFQTKGEK